jgi:hypothetical protein
MRPYLAWLLSATAAFAASIHTTGVSAAFVGGRGPSMAFHSRPPSFQRPAPRPQMTPMAPFAGQHIMHEAQRERGWNDGRWWRFRSRRFAGAWPVLGGWPYVSYGYNYDPYAYGYGFDPYAYGYGYPFTYGQYDSSDGYGYGSYAYGYGVSYGVDDLWPEYDGPGPGYYGGAPTYPVYPYRVAPSAKIIHLTPRQ